MHTTHKVSKPTEKDLGGLLGYHSQEPMKHSINCFRMASTLSASCSNYETLYFTSFVSKAGWLQNIHNSWCSRHRLDYRAHYFCKYRWSSLTQSWNTMVKDKRSTCSEKSEALLVALLYFDVVCFLKVYKRFLLLFYSNSHNSCFLL